MANPEHLAKLLEGPEAWNRCRKEHLDVLPDFGEADLCGANLSHSAQGKFGRITFVEAPRRSSAPQCLLQTRSPQVVPQIVEADLRCRRGVSDSNRIEKSVLLFQEFLLYRE